MSNPNENDKPDNNQGDPGLNEQNNSASQNAPPSDSADQKNKKGKQENPTIEEHKKNLNISAPVFAAVMQSKGWASGKRVPEASFKKAVEDFLNAPMDGVYPTVEEHQRNLKLDGPTLEAVVKAKGWRINSRVSETALIEAVKEHKAKGGK